MSNGGFGASDGEIIKKQLLKMWDSGYTQGLLALNAHINTQIKTPNSQAKLIQQIIVIMLEAEQEEFAKLEISDTPED
jgi:hypothetical protein